MTQDCNKYSGWRILLLKDVLHPLLLPTKHFLRISGCCRSQKMCRELWSLTPAARGMFRGCWLMFPHIGAIKSRFVLEKDFEVRHPGMVCNLICAINLWFLYSVAYGYWKVSELLKESNWSQTSKYKADPNIKKLSIFSWSYSSKGVIFNFMIMDFCSVTST